VRPTRGFSVLVADEAILSLGAAFIWPAPRTPQLFESNGGDQPV